MHAIAEISFRNSCLALVPFRSSCVYSDGHDQKEAGSSCRENDTMSAMIKDKTLCCHSLLPCTTDV